MTDLTSTIAGSSAATKQEIRSLVTGAQTLTVGASGQYSTIQAAIDYILTQPAFVALASPSGISVTGFAINTSAITVSAITGNFYPHKSMWIKLTGDTYYYPVESSSGFATGSGTMYSAMRRIDAYPGGTIAATLYTENQFTIELLDAAYAETITINAPACIKFTSKMQAFWDIQLVLPGFSSGRLEFDNVRLYNGAHPAGVSLLGSNVTTVKLVMNYTEINGIAADFFSPLQYIGSVEANFLTFVGSLNSTRGHLFNFYTPGDQKFKNIIFEFNNNASLAVPALSNFYFVDRTKARALIIDNLTVILHDPHNDIGAATIVGAGTGASDCNVPYMSLSNITMIYDGTAQATALFRILSLADGAGTNAGSSVIDITNCSLIAPRGTSTRKLVQALANPPAAITVNIGLNPMSLPVDAQANITYATVAASLGSQSTGAGTALLGTNCPANTVSAPETWKAVILADGTTGYVPVWK